MPTAHAHKFLIFLLLLFLILVIILFGTFAAPIILGLILAGISYPLYQKLLTSLKQKNVAALIAVLIVSLIIIVPFLGILTLLASEAVSLFTSIDTDVFSSRTAVRLLNPISETLGVNVGHVVQTQLAPLSGNIGNFISQEIGGFLSNALALTIGFFVMLVTQFYLLRDGKQFAEFLIRLSPLKTKDEINLYETFRETGRAVFYGNVVSALAQGVLGGLGFYFAGLPSPVLWGTLIAFLGLIPLLGPYLIFIPAGIYLLIDGSVGIGIAFLLYNIFIVSLVDNIIKPKLISEKIDLHPFLILLVILGGLKIFGIIGLIYGPLILAIFIALLRVYQAMDPQKSA